MNRYGLPENENGTLDNDDPQVSAFDRFNGGPRARGLFGLSDEGLRRWHEQLRKTYRLAIIDARIARDVSRLSKAIRDGDAKAVASATTRLRTTIDRFG